MALFQTQTAKNSKVPTLLSGTDASIIVRTFVVPTGAVVNDVAEFGAIPHQALITDVEVFQDGVGAGCTADFGLISGNYGETLNSRTCGNEFYAALAISAAGKAAQVTKNLMDVTPKDFAVGFGLKFTGANPTAGKKITIAITLASAGA
jgi:hypothetical protein